MLGPYVLVEERTDHQCGMCTYDRAGSGCRVVEKRTPGGRVAVRIGEREVVRSVDDGQHAVGAVTG